MERYASHRLGIGGARVGVTPRAVAPRAVMTPRTQQLPRPIKPTEVDGRTDTGVVERGGVASTAWIVNAGASYDSAPEGLAERRSWKRAPLGEPANINIASGHVTSELAIITTIPGMLDQMKVAELGNVAPLRRRCLNNGYSFVWTSGRSPYFVTREGTHTPRLVPYGAPCIDAESPQCRPRPAIALGRGSYVKVGDRIWGTAQEDGHC